MRTRSRRAGLLASIVIGLSLAAVSPVNAATLVVNDDTTGPGPAGADCTSPAPHATISSAVAAAAANDTILVCAGTYNESQILINKAVDVIGAGQGASIIDGGNAQNLPAAGLVRTDAAANGDILLRGFTLRNAGQTGTGTSTPRYFMVAKSDDAGTTQSFDQLQVIGLGAGGRDYGLYADNIDSDLNLTNSALSGNDFNPVLVEQVNGAVNIRENTIAKDPTVSSTAIFVFAYSGNNSTRPVRIAGNTIDANGRGGISVQTAFPAGGIPAGSTMRDVSVSSNEITDIGGAGVSVQNAETSTSSGLTGLITDAKINRNSIATGTAGAIGIRLGGNVEDAAIESNDVTGAGIGVRVLEATTGHEPFAPEVHFNRVVTAASGLELTSSSLDAENNWWGCNEGPGQPGCSTVTGGADFSPWLILSTTAGDAQIETGGDSTEVAAALDRNSDGDFAGTGFPDDVSVAFGTDLGTITPSATTENAVAEGELISGATAGAATVTGTLDAESATDTVEFVEDTDTNGANLVLKVTPGTQSKKSGKAVSWSVTAANTGDVDAENAEVCLRSAKLTTRVCDDLGTVAAGAPATATSLGFTIPAKAKAKRYTIKFRLTADGVADDKVRRKLLVKD